LFIQNKAEIDKKELEEINHKNNFFSGNIFQEEQTNEDNLLIQHNTEIDKQITKTIFDENKLYSE